MKNFQQILATIIVGRNPKDNAAYTDLLVESFQLVPKSHRSVAYCEQKSTYDNEFIFNLHIDTIFSMPIGI